MKIVVTKEELLELCSQCAENTSNCKCSCMCLFYEICGGAYIDFLRDNTELKG